MGVLGVGCRAMGAAVVLCGLWGCNGGRLQHSQAELQALPVDFGPVIVGQSQTARVRLVNNGAALIHVRGLQAKSPFSGVTLATPLEVPAGATRELEVSFQPSEVGAQSQAAVIDSDADSADPAQLSGFGAQLGIEAPQTLDFGAVDVGTTRTLPLTLRGTGNVASPFSISGLDGADAALFRAATPSGPVPSGGELSLPITLRASHLGAISATLRVSPCPSCQPLEIALEATGIASALEVEPSHLDFGPVTVGLTSARVITLTNLGQTPLHVTQVFVTATSDAAFSVPTAPFSLAPGAKQTLSVGFAPADSGFKQGTVRIVSDDPQAPRIDVPLQGGASGMETVVQPLALDFGQVAVGFSAQRMVTLYNVSAAATVTLESARITLGATFAAGIPGPIAIAPGDHFSIPVLFSPGSVNPVSGNLELVTDEPGGTPTEVTLAGSGIQPGPCSWRAMPSPLNFMSAIPGESRNLAVAITNTGANDCYVGNVDLTPTSDPAFALTDGPVPSAVLHPGDLLTIRVTFAPPAVGLFNGVLQFVVADPAHPLGSVPIVGSAANGCLRVDPVDLDFGHTPGTCPARIRAVQAINSCPQNLTLSSVALGGGDSTEFAITGGNTGPHTLAANSAESFDLAYHPVNDGPDSQALVFSLDDGTQVSSALEGVGVMSPTQTDYFDQQERAKVDLLFIVDNSGSMADKQAKLAANFQTFFQAATSQNADFHIAVTTTNIAPVTGGWTICPGGAQGGEGGRFFPVDGSSPRIITNQTPNAAQAFATDVNVGTCSWLEEGLQAAYLALSPPLVGEADDPTTPLANDGNAGFLRPDAKLSMVAVSDADDQSSQPVSFFESYFRGLKGNQPGQFVFSGIVTPVDHSSCAGGESAGNRYTALALDTGGIVENICDGDWALPIAHIAAAAFGPTTHFPLSGRPGDPAQITVSVNGQAVTTGWTYDPTTNAVNFDPGDAPTSGSSVDITYPLGC